MSHLGRKGYQKMRHLDGQNLRNSLKATKIKFEKNEATNILANNKALKIPLSKDEPSWQERPPKDETS